MTLPIKVCGFAGTLMMALGFAAAPARAEPGTWQEHQYTFVFLGFTSTYSCDGLADKLKVLLLAAGARADAKSSPGACAAGFGRPDKFARADLKFYTLTPTATLAGAAPGVVGSPASNPSVPGDWRRVEFVPHQPRELGIGDCEVVEQFKASVLPMFTTRNVESHTTCIPNQDSGSLIDLHFEAFAVLPEKTAAP